MTVRTDKIQSLTGSSPLTLPTSLPATKTEMKVTSTGVLSAAPVAGATFNSLYSNAETGWVLLDVKEEDAMTENVEVGLGSNSAYSASDIYVYKFVFDLQHDNSSAQTQNYHIEFKTYNGSTNIDQSTMSSMYGWYDEDSGSYGAGVGNGGGYSGGNYSAQWTSIGTGQSSNNTYSEMFTSSNVGGGYSWEKGIWGELKYYNGRAYRHQCTGMKAICYDKPSWNSNYVYQYYWQRGHSNGNNFKYGSVSGNDANYADTFKFGFSQSGDRIRGYVQLWGIPKSG